MPTAAPRGAASSGPSPSNGGAVPSVGVFISAPHGAADLGRLLSALRGQIGPADRLVILDGTAGSALVDASSLPGVGCFEHVRGAGESGFHLRARVAAMADRDITIVLEDHVVPGPRFVAEARRLFADRNIVAVKLLGRNDTSTGPWSWANFLMTFCDCLHPADAIPAAMLSTSAAVRTSAMKPLPPTLGAWDSEFMPRLGRLGPGALAWSNDLWIDHADHCDMKLALLGNFRNQRAVAALRIARGQRRGKHMARAFKDLALRRPGHIARALAGRDAYRHFAANRVKVVVICWASMLGAVAGAWFGAGSSMRKMH